MDGKTNREISRKVKLIRDPHKLTFKTIGSQVYQRGIMNELLSRGWVRCLGEGLIVFSGGFVRIMGYFHNVFKSVAKKFNAEEIVLPDLMPLSAIQDSQYLRSFPHQALLVSHIEVKRLGEQISNKKKSESVDRIDLIKLPVKQFSLLTPTVCLNIFELWRGKRIQQNQPLISTSTKRCFRNEKQKLLGLERLMNFTMLEIVFCGSPAFVIKTREALLSCTARILQENNLIGEVRRGKDPFFKADFQDSRILFKSLLQERFGVKYELLLSLPGERREIAVSSYNVHFEYFTRAFDIKKVNKGTIWSGCVGFGLERWAFAFLAQYGLDAETWPLPMQQELYDKKY